MTSLPAVIPRAQLPIGELLAEGGEGRVHELAGRTASLVKLYRSPVPARDVQALLDWQAQLGATAPALAGRVLSSAAWPTAVVAADDDPTMAAGILLPRAPRRFSLRHRDGSVRLASLSYLTAPPGQRVAAYGLALPARFSAERLGIVYALARLLEAFQAVDPAIGHGDLSAKNVLWSLERGPEVFVLDCDSADCHPGGAGPEPDPLRRRAMTPNWDDPAIAPGANPTLESDRYSLALIFLRVTGAAHFPLQQRQRAGEDLRIDIAVPAAASVASGLAPDAAVWDLCERSLSVTGAAERPRAGEWVAALEQVLDDLGAMRTVRAVWAAQGGGAPGPTPPAPPPRSARPARDVVVTPVPGSSAERPWSRVGAARPAPAAGRPAPPRPGAGVAAGGFALAGAAPSTARRRAGAPSSPVAGPRPPSVLAAARRNAKVAARAWMQLHRRMARALSTRGRRGAGVARLAGCVLVDLGVGIVALFGAAMVLAPFLRI